MHSEQFYYFCSSLARVAINHVRKFPDKWNRILIVKQDEIGDMIYCLHALQAIRTQHPDSHITLACKPMLFELMKTQRVADELVQEWPKNQRFDLVLNLRSGYDTLFRALFSRGFYLDRGTVRFRQKINGKQEHEVHTNWEMVKPILTDQTLRLPTIHIDAESLMKVEEVLAPIAGKSYVVLHCGAREAGRRWPKDRFAQLIHWIHSTERQEVVLIGGPDEVQLNEEVISMSGVEKALNLAGKTTLLELAGILLKAHAFIGNESGPLTMATVIKTPLIGLFGPGVKDVFYPLYPHQEVVHHLQQKNQGDDLMLLITLEEVKDLYRKIAAT